MMKFQQLAATAAVLVVAAGSAQAATFATVSGAILAFSDLRYAKTGPYAGGDSLVGRGKNTFSFTVDNLPENLKGVLKFTNAGTLGKASESIVGNKAIFTQGGYMGSFSEVYSGKKMTVDGVKLINNVTVLLSGYFDNGVLTGIGTGGTLDATVTSYSSPFWDFNPGSVDFNLSLKGASSHWALDHGIMKSATTVDLSRFDETIPEPASWSLMLLGVCACGAALRRKRSPAAAIG